MLDAVILDEVTLGRLNPPTVVDQLRMLPIAVPTAEFVDELEAEFLRIRQQREEGMKVLAKLLPEQQFKDDGEEINEVVAAFERHADEVGAKLKALEKRLRRAQGSGLSRNHELDDRLLNVARQDFEDRIDMAVFWRAMQAKLWPTPVSESYATGSEIGDALRAALG